MIAYRRKSGKEKFRKLYNFGIGSLQKKDRACMILFSIFYLGSKRNEP
jgi:hypothetical protein